MRSGPQEKGVILELGERSIRAFFFEHPMSTYAAALGYPDFFDRAMDQARAQSSRYVPQQLEPVVEQAREQVRPLLGMIERAEKQAGGKLLFFGVAVALWSVSAVGPPLNEAF